MRCGNLATSLDLVGLLNVSPWARFDHGVEAEAEKKTDPKTLLQSEATEKRKFKPVRYLGLPSYGPIILVAQRGQRGTHLGMGIFPFAVFFYRFAEVARNLNNRFSCLSGFILSLLLFN